MTEVGWRESASKWIHVEFMGRLPEGQALKSPDPLEAGRVLAELFGFEYVDALIAFPEAVIVPVLAAGSEAQGAAERGGQLA